MEDREGGEEDRRREGEREGGWDHVATLDEVDVPGPHFLTTSTHRPGCVGTVVVHEIFCNCTLRTGVYLGRPLALGFLGENARPPNTPLYVRTITKYFQKCSSFCIFFHIKNLYKNKKNVLR